MSEKRGQSEPPVYFEQLNLHKILLNNLKKHQFVKLTPIQQFVIPELLERRNVFGLAKVGSGKTLAFVLPSIQALLTLKWMKLDGLGVLIIVPTRELGIQIFQVINKVADGLALVCGLVCGGHKYAEEARLIAAANVLVCTPGRLIQHLNQSHTNLGDQLQYLIFDEIDELLCQGFMGQLQEIVQYFPRPFIRASGELSRVTAFFSATQHSKIDKLLSQMSSGEINYELVPLPVNVAPQNLKRGEIQLSTYRSPIELGSRVSQIIKVSTYPAGAETAERCLQQSRRPESDVVNPLTKTIVAELRDYEKIDALFSVIRQLQDEKGIVFFATCREVQYFAPAFATLNCGATVIALTSRESQRKRQTAVAKFRALQRAYLFTTDIIARGFDAPDVSVVIQADCPQDVRTFIHRAGRATRHTNKGVNLLLLNNQENAFLKRLDDHKLNYQTRGLKVHQQITIGSALAAYASSDVNITNAARKAIQAYFKHLFIQQDKEVFQFNSYNFDRIALSFGVNTHISFGTNKRGGDNSQKATQMNEKEDLGNAELSNDQYSDDELLTLKENNQTGQSNEQIKQNNQQIKQGINQDEFAQSVYQRALMMQARLEERNTADKQDYKALRKKMRNGVNSSDEENDAHVDTQEENDVDGIEEYEEFEEWGEPEEDD